jgi:hypothetical protein
MPPQDRPQAWKEFVSDMKAVRRLAQAEKKQAEKKAA